MFVIRIQNFGVHELVEDGLAELFLLVGSVIKQEFAQEVGNDHGSLLLVGYVSKSVRVGLFVLR